MFTSLSIFTREAHATYMHSIYMYYGMTSVFPSVCHKPVRVE